MKRKLLPIISLFLILAVTMISCQEELLSIDIPVKNQTIVFDVEPASKSAENSPKVKEVLYNGIIYINIAQAMEAQNVSFEQLKSFLLTQGTLEEEIPAGYDMSKFIGAELYFDNMDSLSNLVARADIVEGSKLRFTIVNGELLDQLQNDQLHVIFVGIRPSVPLRLKLEMDFMTNFRLIR